MSTQLREPATAVRALALTDAEHVVVEAMTVRLLRRDRATLTDGTRIAVRSDQIAAAVDRVCDALVAAGPGTAGLAGDIAVAAPHAHAAIVDDAVADVTALVTSRSRALLVLIDVCLFAPDRAAWNSRARRRALHELTAALPHVDLADLERVQYEVAAARRALAWRRIRWGRVVAPATTDPADALRLAVVTCVVVISEQQDAETVKQVVQRLEEQLAAVVATLGAPTEPVESGRNRQLGAALEAAIDLIPARPGV